MPFIRSERRPPNATVAMLARAAILSHLAIAALFAPSLELLTPASAKDAASKSAGEKSGKQVNSIVALVNDEPITGFELQQRALMLSGGDVQKKAQEYFKAKLKNPSTTERLKAIFGATIKANEGKSKDEIIAIFDRQKKEFAKRLQQEAIEQARSSSLPSLKKKALDELIEEKLKLQEAKRQGVSIGDDEINRVLESIAKRNNMSTSEFLSKVGPGLGAMKERIRSSLSWTDVVRRRFGAQVAVAQRDVDRLVAESSANDAQDQVDLSLQRIIITTPVKIEQFGIAQRMNEAEKIRAKFTDCKSTPNIAAGAAGAKFEEIGRRNPASFPEPTRSLLLTAKDGEMLPPTVSPNGIELLVVCSRSVVKADDQMRNKAEGELKQREFELLAQRHLKDLRQDAHIEYR